MVARTPQRADGSLVLPWLLKVELGGECKLRFEARDKLWTESPTAAILPAVEPGYGTLIRWYENAMSYYWTGWPGYRQRAQELLKPVLADQAEAHQYVVEFFVRAYDMLDDSALFSPEERQGVDRLICKNFWERLYGVDGSWMVTFSEPYDQIELSNRHAVAPWMADTVTADFLHDYVDLSGELEEVVEFRRHEKHRFFDYMVSERWGGSLPRLGADHETEIVETLFRYALENERYDFFEKGNARRALGLERLSHLQGIWVDPAGPPDQQLLLGILATYYGEGRYALLRQTIPLIEHPKGPFMMRYVCGTRKYTPGPELPAVAADALAGVRIPDMMPHVKSRLASINVDKYQRPSNPERALDFVSFRSGFGPADDYVALNGLAGLYPPGAFLSFVSQGCYWFGVGSSTIFSPASDRYFDQNAVSVLRTDRWLQQGRPYAGAAELNWVANLQHAGLGTHGGGVSMTMDPFMDTRWQRDVVWVNAGLYVVRDAVTAKEAGRFEVALNWRPAGGARWDGAALRCTTNTGCLQITPLGSQFRVSQNLDPVRADSGDLAYFRQTASVALKPDEELAATTMLQAFQPGGEPVYAARSIGPGALLLRPDAATASPILVAWGPVNLEGIRSDAKALVLSEDRLQMLSGTSLDVDGKAVLSLSRPASAVLDWQKGALLVDAGKGGELRVALLSGDAQAREWVTGDGAQPHELGPGASDICRAVLPARLAKLLAAPATVVDTAASAADSARLPLQDQVAQWETAWTYAGLQRPTPILTVRRLAADLVDLGGNVDLAEIRAVMVNLAIWRASELPPEIWTAAADPSGAVPPADSPAWVRMTAPVQWRPSVISGNYGRAEPIEHGYQFVQPQGVKARYVRATNAPELVYYDAGRLASRRPLRLEAGDFGGDGHWLVLAATDTWPPFTRVSDKTDDSLALLNAEGGEVLRYDEPTNMQAARLLDVDGSGHRKLVEASIDGKVRIFSLTGAVEKTLDLVAMHREFNLRFGRPNTRHPAGGLTMPYDVGLWRPGPGGLRKMIVTRYGAVTFLDEQGAFEGLNCVGGYVVPRVLEDGIDFNGDGIEEQLLVESQRLFQIGGDNTPVIADPAGDLFFPQTYSAKLLGDPDGDTRINGAPILLLRPLAWGGKPRYVAVVKEHYLGLYDGLQNVWAFTWVPLVRMSAAAVVTDTPDSLKVIATTNDDLLWELNWSGSLAQLADFRVRPLPDRINRITALPTAAGAAVFSGNAGLYLFPGGDQLVRVASGSFNDARALPGPDGSRPAIIAATRDGRVLRLNARP